MTDKEILEFKRALKDFSKGHESITVWTEQIDGGVATNTHMEFHRYSLGIKEARVFQFQEHSIVLPYDKIEYFTLSSEGISILMKGRVLVTLRSAMC